MENDETSPLRKTPKLQYDSSKRSTPDKSTTSSASSTKVPSSFAGALIPVAPTGSASTVAAAAAKQKSNFAAEKAAAAAAVGARYTPSTTGGGSAASNRSGSSVGSSIGSTTLFPSSIRPVGEKMIFGQRKSALSGGGAVKQRSAGRSPPKGSAGGGSQSSPLSASSSGSGMSPCPLDECKQRAGLQTSAKRQAVTGGTTPKRGEGVGTTSKAGITTRQPMPKIAFEKRSDDECMGGVVRWAEKCERHIVRRQPWNCTRWTESKLQHPNMIGRPVWEPDPNMYVGTTREQKQQPLYSLSKANCDHCEKRFCGGGLNPNFAPPPMPPAQDSPCSCCCSGGGGGRAMGSPYDGGWPQPQGPQPPPIPDNIPFMRAPQCPEDHLFDTPQRCQARFGMGQQSSSSAAMHPPMKGPAGYSGMSHHMVANVMKIPLASRQGSSGADISNGTGGRTYLSLPSTSSADNRFNNIISHISGFDSQLTVPMNTNYVGYSQKYPQDIIKSNDSKTD